MHRTPRRLAGAGGNFRGTTAAAQEQTEIGKLRAEKLARERRHIMNCDNGHLGKYPDSLKPGDPVDPGKSLAWRFLAHETPQVDAIPLSTGAGDLSRYTHRTEVGEDSPAIAVHLIVAGIKDPAEVVTRLNGRILQNGTIEGDA